MSDAPKGGNPKVAKKGKNALERKEGRSVVVARKSARGEERKAMVFTSTTFSGKSTQTLEFQAKQCLS